MCPLDDGEVFRHLGSPTSFPAGQTLQAPIQDLISHAGKTDRSLLAPWRKTDALDSFLLPRISSVLRGSAMAQTPLNRDNSSFTALLEKRLHLPKRDTNDILLVPQCQRGAGNQRRGNCAAMLWVPCTFCLLTCPDRTMKTTADGAFHSGPQRRLGRGPLPGDSLTT